MSLKKCFNLASRHTSCTGKRVAVWTTKLSRTSTRIKPNVIRTRAMNARIRVAFKSFSFAIRTLETVIANAGVEVQAIDTLSLDARVRLAFIDVGVAVVTKETPVAVTVIGIHTVCALATLTRVCAAFIQLRGTQCVRVAGQAYTFERVNLVFAVDTIHARIRRTFVNINATVDTGEAIIANTSVRVDTINALMATTWS